MAKKESPVRILKRHATILSCKLTDEEFRDRASNLAATLEDIKAEDSRHEMLKREMKSALSALEARRDVLALTVSRRSEMREVEVEDQANDKTGMVDRIRMDTGEIVLTRVMNDQERQIPMPV